MPSHMLGKVIGRRWNWMPFSLWVGFIVLLFDSLSFSQSRKIYLQKKLFTFIPIKGQFNAVQVRAGCAEGSSLILLSAAPCLGTGIGQ